MPGRRRLWSLLVLAAVFVMHGVQCMEAFPDNGHVAMAPAGPSPAMERPSGLDAAPDAMAVGLAFTSAVVHSVGGPISGVLPVDRDSGHGADLWALCLAVVVGGLVLLGVLGLLRRGAVTPVRGSPSPLSASRVIANALRPPELSCLCLLRI